MASPLPKISFLSCGGFRACHHRMLALGSFTALSLTVAMEASTERHAQGQSRSRCGAKAASLAPSLRLRAAAQHDRAPESSCAASISSGAIMPAYIVLLVVNIQ